MRMLRTGCAGGVHALRSLFSTLSGRILSLRNYRLLASITVFGSLGFVYACSGDDAVAPQLTGDDAGADVTNVDGGTTPIVDSGPGDSAFQDASDAATLPPNTIVQLAVAGEGTCALLASGDVWCWGGNGFGQQGNGTFDALVHAPTKVASLPLSVAIAAGNHHVCALDATGVVRCWGSNQLMTLGHDNALDASVEAGADVLCAPGFPCNPTPRVVPGLAAVKVIGAAVWDSCVRLTTGEVKCWGLNYTFGVLGHPGPDLGCGPLGDACSYTPGTVSGVPDGPVVVGGLGACVLSSGAVSCWGNNTVSELAIVADNLPHPTPVAINGLPAIKAIGYGGGSPYGIAAGGALYGWGVSTAGELGAGCTPITTSPTLVLEAGVVDVSGGAQFACALVTGGAVTCWGSDIHGSLGTTDSGATCQLPTQVAGLTGVTKIGVGIFHVCAVKNDNSVWCWGYNDVGQTGHDPITDPNCGTTKCSPTPTKVNGLP